MLSCLTGMYSVWAQTGNDEAFCFDFTWLGPQFTNESVVNGTCDSMDPEPTICVNPLVYTGQYMHVVDIQINRQGS